MSYVGLLCQKCQIERRTNSVNQYGQMVQSWSVVYQDVVCRVDKIGNFTSTLAQTPTGQTSRNEFVVFMLKDQDVIPGDRLTMNETGEILYVTPYLNVMAGKGLHHKEVYAAVQET